MSRFEEMMHSELPSKRRDLFTEMYEDSDDFGMSDSDMEKYMERECGDNYDEGYCVGGSCDEDCDDDFECGDNFECGDDDDFMDRLDDVVDDEDDLIDDVTDDDDDDDFDDDDFDDDDFDDDDSNDDAQISNDDEVEDGDLELGPDGEQRVNDALDTIATPLLLAEEFTESELEAFIESVDCDIAMNEGYITEKTFVRLDKKAKKARAYEVAVFKIARENNDRLYRKLETIWAMERKLKADLRAKYNSYARRMANEYIQRLASSNSKVVSKLGKMLLNKKKKKPVATRKLLPG